VGDAMAAQSVQRTGGHEGTHDSLRPAPVQEPPPLASLVSRLGTPRRCASLSRRCAQTRVYTVGRIQYSPPFVANKGS
jgi:hypothetical protein